MTEPTPELPPAASTLSEQERLHGALAHVLIFSGFVIPFGNVLGPLLIMLLQPKPGSPFVLAHAKESLNFQLTLLIPFILFAVMSIFIIGLPFLCALIIFELVVVIKATVKANAGEEYRYPLTIRFLT